MKFYVASSLANKEQVQYVSEKLKKKGYTHTYDWTKNERASTLEELQTIGEAEKKAVLESDFIIVVLPGGKGTHIELGIAIGLDKTIFLYSPDQSIEDYESSCTFYHIEGVQKCFGRIEDLVYQVSNRFE